MKKGFTLIEVIVSMGIFAIAALLATSSLLSLTDAQKRSLSLQTTYDNVRFAIETMAKDIRMGSLYTCGSDPANPPTIGAVGVDCISGGPVITYRNSSNDDISYRILNGHIDKYINGVPVGVLTSADANIDTLDFYVVGAADPTTFQPRVVIVIKGTAGTGRAQSSFNLQTTVSQRKIGS